MYRIYRKRGWQPFGGALQGAGVGILFVFILTLKGSLRDGDYLTLVMLFALGMLFFVSGTLVKRWAKKNGKK